MRFIVDVIAGVKIGVRVRINLRKKKGESKIHVKIIVRGHVNL